MNRISITHLARNLADIVNRVVYRGERFQVIRGNRPVVDLVPPPRARRLGDLPGILDRLPRLVAEDAEELSKELDAAREALDSVPRTGGGDPWVS